MRFYTLAERKPIEGQIILAKIDRRACCGNYYILEYEAGWGWEVDEGKPFHFVEASGERYMTIDEEDIIGWMPIENLNEIKVGE